MPRTILPCSMVLLMLLGCSTGPRFQARPPGSAAPGTLPMDPAEMARLGQREPAFVAVPPLNPVQPDWLSAPTNFFRLGPGDSIEIEMLGETGTLATLPVGPDGKIYYNLLPGTFVWGLTLSEAKGLIETNLARYVRVKPEVALTLRGVGSQRIWILGSVQRPGVYTLATPMTVLEALSAVGGTVIAQGSSQEIADLNNSFVMREGKVLGVDFYRLLRQGDLSQNIYLQPDDFIYLRPGVSHDIAVLGAVKAPNIISYTADSSVLSVIASAGGPIPYAYLSHVAIVRGSLTHSMIATVDYKDIAKGKATDVRLEPGDIVYVPLSPYRFVEQLAEQILTQFVRTIAINEGRNAVSKQATPVQSFVPLGGP